MKGNPLNPRWIIWSCKPNLCLQPWNNCQHAQQLFFLSWEETSKSNFSPQHQCLPCRM